MNTLYPKSIEMPLCAFQLMLEQVLDYIDDNDVYNENNRDKPFKNKLKCEIFDVFKD